MIYFCCDDNRRALVRQMSNRTGLNGIDYLEVISTGLSIKEKQRHLRIFFVNTVANNSLFQLLDAFRHGNLAVSISGGERARKVVVDKTPKFDEATGCLKIHVTPRGDFSAYTLHLYNPDSETPLSGLDPQLASIDFSFKVECPSDFDCRSTRACPPLIRETPELDYLAKDFTSFRRLILDRMALIAPGWRERNPADPGMVLVEMLAYVGDHLSYRQDAIATEAYLGTAHQRVSVRRHARLLDYAMHDGCNARVWVQVRLKESAPAAGVILPRNSLLHETDQDKIFGTCFSTNVGADSVLAQDANELKQIITVRKPEVFEPMHDVYIHPAHNEMSFYTWGEETCCLPKGAVKAALAGSYPCLKAGQVLIFKERINSKTGRDADADPARRHAVRLTRVSSGEDPLILSGDDPTPFTEIEWGNEDALPFPFCICAGSRHDVSIALGNIVLADHGYTQQFAPALDPVPSPDPVLAPVAAASDSVCCCEDTVRLRPARFRPALTVTGLTHSQDLPQGFESSAAARVICQNPRKSLPAIRLSDGRGGLWEPQRDLIGSDATALEFVAEIENNGTTRIRFGDDSNGMQPAEGTIFTPRYRTGNGTQGNIGAGSIRNVFAPLFLDPVNLELLTGIDAGIIESVTNPIAARGGDEPETLEEVRLYAPQAFKEPRRCVTPEDYARRAGEHSGVQRAAATIRWTGSWHTIFLTVDRRDGKMVTEKFASDLLAWLEPWRMAGHDLEVNRPVFVSLEISLLVCVAEEHFRSDVKAALLDAFSAQQRPDGHRGFFHPDNWTFGQSVAVSRIYAVAQSIPGVRHVEVNQLRRQGSKDRGVPYELTFGMLEIPRLDNDPNYPDHGTLNVEMRGGR
ncbi:MAG: putative baseplate assembly protein [Desulfuromonadaceae bacterium]